MTTKTKSPIERPILFNGAMVRAVLAGTKTQTRRVVKGAPAGWSPMQPQVFSPKVIGRRGDEQPGPDSYGSGNEDGEDWIRFPYGAPGDRLWVRETWNRFEQWKGFSYAADHEGFGIGPDDDPDHVPEHAVRWKPSIHMPRAASRITLEITGVRVERLQDISEADCWAEGIEQVMDSFDNAAQCAMAARLGASIEDAKPVFALLWESINGPGSCDATPWLWVVEFRRVHS